MSQPARTGTAPKSTSLLRGTTVNGPVALLVEVKLSEHDFGHCSAAVNPNNDTRHVCKTNGAFGGDPAACFQLRNHGLTVRRRYDEYVPATAPNPPTTDACWYRGSASQPMRNVALTNVLRRRDRLDARYALCAPLANQAIWQRWDDAIDVLPEDIVIDLPAEHVLAHLPQDTVAHLRQRYLLDQPRRHDVVTDREWLTWQLVASLTERYEAPPRVIETHPGGGMYDCITMTWPGPWDTEPRIDLNRAGSAHVWIHGDLRSMPDAWRQASRVGIDTVADDLALLAELRPTPADRPRDHMAVVRDLHPRRPAQRPPAVLAQRIPRHIRLRRRTRPRLLRRLPNTEPPHWRRRRRRRGGVRPLVPPRRRNTRRPHRSSPSEQSFVNRHRRTSCGRSRCRYGASASRRSCLSVAAFGADGFGRGPRARATQSGPNPEGSGDKMTDRRRGRPVAL